MKTSLEHLPLDKQQLLKKITNSIVEKVQPEKIILFGSYATGKWVEDQYIEDGRLFEYRSDYDILVITKEGDLRPDHEVQEIAEYRTGQRNIISVISHDITYINGKLSDGQYFFSDIQKEGILLYDAGNVSLAEKRELTAKEKRAFALEDFDLWFPKSKVSLEIAEFCLSKGHLNDAVFALHQASERGYNALILVYRGYKPKTHNLEKLYHYTKSFSAELARVFPQNTENETGLFILLKNGYIEARYNKNYIITKEQVEILIDRVAQLIKIVEVICKEKINSF